MTTQTNDNPNVSDDRISRLLKSFKACQDYYDKDYEIGREDNRFLQVDSWDPNVKKLRLSRGQPCLKIPRLHPFVHQVENEIRQSRPAIKVSPVDDQADKATARVIQGIVRNIEVVSGADNVYDTASSNAIRVGYGWIRVNTRYADERSFDQEIEIIAVDDAFSVYIDPDHKKKDASDANYGIIFEDVPREQFAADYPKADQVSFKDHGQTGWCTDDKIRIAEYFHKDFEKTTIYRLPGYPDGKAPQVMTAKEAERAGIDVSQVPKEDQRETRIPTIKWCKCTAAEELEETTWPGKYIPLVPVYGDMFWLDGKRSSRSLIHHAKDSQRYLEYMRSASAEVIALQPKAPFIGPVGSFDTYRDAWTKANTENKAFLEYDPVFSVDEETSQKVLLPGPQRQPTPTGSMALFQEGMVASDDIKAAIGMFNSSMGEEGNEKSGRAILARQQQGNNATFHFMDNLATAIRHVGRIIVDLIPYIITGPQVQRIIGEDGSEENVQVNQAFQDPKTGEEVLYDLNTGKYDVTVSVGPAFATKRIETVNALLDLIQAVPAMAPAAAEIIAKNLDVAEADTLAQRMKAMMPPEMQGDDPNAAKLAQADNVIKTLTQQIEQMDKALNDKSATEQLDREVKLGELEIKRDEVKIKKVQAITGAAATHGQRIDSMQAEEAEEGQGGEPANQWPPGVTPEKIVEAIVALENQVEDVAAATEQIIDHMDGDNDNSPAGDEATAEPFNTAA